jgi:hypothetical protein
MNRYLINTVDILLENKNEEIKITGFKTPNILNVENYVFYDKHIRFECENCKQPIIIGFHENGNFIRGKGKSSLVSLVKGENNDIKIDHMKFFFK